MSMVESKSILFLRKRSEVTNPGLKQYRNFSFEQLAHWHTATQDLRDLPSDIEAPSKVKYNKLLELNPLAREFDRHMFEFCTLDFYCVPHLPHGVSPYLSLDCQEIQLLQTQCFEEYIDYLKSGKMSRCMFSAQPGFRPRRAHASLQAHILSFCTGVCVLWLFPKRYISTHTFGI